MTLLFVLWGWGITIGSIGQSQLCKKILVQFIYPPPPPHTHTQYKQLRLIFLSINSNMKVKFKGQYFHI